MGRKEGRCDNNINEKVGRLQLTGLVSVIVILAGMFLVPVEEGFLVSARNTLGVLLAVIVLLVTEALPLGIVCLMSAAFLYFFTVQILCREHSVAIQIRPCFLSWRPTGFLLH